MSETLTGSIENENVIVEEVAETKMSARFKKLQKQLVKPATVIGISAAIIATYTIVALNKNTDETTEETNPEV